MATLKQGLILIGILLNLCGEIASASALKWNTEGTNFALSFDQPGVEHKFTCTNTSNKVVTIEMIRTSCGCTAAKMAKTKLGAGEKADLIVDVDARKITGNTTKFVIVKTDETDLGVYQLNLSLSRPSPWAPILNAVYWVKTEVLSSKEIPLMLSVQKVSLVPVGAVSLFPDFCQVGLVTKDPKSNTPYCLILTPRKRGIAGMQPVELLIKAGNKIMSFKLPLEVNVD